MTKIYQVSFPNPINGQSDYFFGSLAAIYDVFSAEDIGCRVARLWSIGVGDGAPYVGRRCTIRVHDLIRKKTKRGNSKL